MQTSKNIIEGLYNSGQISYHYKTPSMFYEYEKAFNTVLLSLMMFVPPIVVLVPGLYNIFKILKSGYIKYIVNTRKQYRKFIRNEIFNCYKYALIIPIIYLIVVLGCGILTNFSLELSQNGLDANYYDISFNNPYILILMTFINLFLADLFYINVGLISASRIKNFLVNIIFSYLIITIIGISSELIGIVLSSYTKNDLFANIGSFYNLWRPQDSGNILFVSVFLLILCSISFVIVVRIYKNEEEVVNGI